MVNSYRSLWEDNEKLTESDLKMFLPGQISAVVNDHLQPPQDRQGASTVPQVLDMPRNPVAPIRSCVRESVTKIHEVLSVHKARCLYLKMHIIRSFGKDCLFLLSVCTMFSRK